MRQWVGSAMGLAMVISVSGVHAVHPILTTVVNLLILKFSSKAWCHMHSLLFSFTYLLLFRLVSYFGLPSPPGHANAIQMMITLKLVGVCYEVHDSWQLENKLKASEKSASEKVSLDDPVESATPEGGEVRKRLRAEAPPSSDDSTSEHEKLLLKLQHEAVAPSPLDIIHYSFFYCGILTGPYYKYSVYRDLIESRSGGAALKPWSWCLRRLTFLPLYAVLFLTTSYYFPLKFAEGPEIFHDYSFMYRVLYMTPVFFMFRMRLYAGFVLSECVCLMAGLGAYPAASCPKPGQGPTDLLALQTSADIDNESFSYETVHNIDEYGSDFSPTVRGGMRCWNMTVQYWLASNIYRRLKAPKPVKEAVTMLTSAFWHGMHSGYYLSMLTVPFILMVEDYYARLIRKRLATQGARVYDWVTWFLKMQWFAYMGMAFLLLDVEPTLRYWHSIGYIGHGLILILHAFAQFINLIVGKANDKLKKCRDTAFGSESRLRVKSVPDQGTDQGAGQADCITSEEQKKLL
ncbi:Membrane bound O-acyl transferase MBOAT [Trinorchestia longiramus]|nr:Membrane bound O-acyl transferase MBOAT [Trinorchestia longiramus]